MKNSTRNSGNKLPWIIWLVFLMAAPVMAQGQLKVAIVNSQKAFDQSQAGQKAVAILKEREDQLKADLKQMDEELRKLRDKLASQKLTLSSEAQSQLQQEIDRKQAERQKYEQENTRLFEQFKDQLIKKIREEMLAVIDELIKERGYELVFDLSTSGLIYYRPELDITDEVIKRYNASQASRK
ncbi:MAG: OmpH family outer membrane protein [Candidatus Saccharicenans sp.]|jgi:outer membrane protein|nr:OmpH family outer membrane protein [Candidatus Saccharicenans sp.]MDH7493407.1 OmpH family outer membrane protein [Candidatus Saccharicenans sp.]